MFKFFTLEKLFWIVSLILIGLIIVFSYLNSFSVPHVREFYIEKGNANNAALVGQRFKLKFSRPMINDIATISKYFQFTPTLDFRLSWVNGDLYIIPSTNLVSNTNYSLKISKEFTDVYNNPLGEDFVSEFKTRETSVAYINKELTAIDKVIQLGIESNNSKILFESETIKFFEKNEDYLVVCITDETTKTDEIIVKDLKNNTEFSLGLKNQKINQLDLSTRYNSFMYITQNVEEKNGFLIPKSTNKAQIYDITTRTSKAFNPSGTAEDLLDALFTPDGETILYRSSDSYYYLAGIISESDPISIGRFTSTGGFSRSGTQIIFSNYDPLVTYSSFPFITKFTNERKSINVTNADSYTIDPIFNPAIEEEVYYAERFKEVTGAQGLFQIVKYNGTNKTVILKDEIFSLELPQISQDGKFLSVEKYTQIDLLNYSNQRSFVNQRKPNQANIVIYNLITNQKVIEIEDGIEVEWER